jgi:hypothetical protein
VTQFANLQPDPSPLVLRFAPMAQTLHEDWLTRHNNYVRENPDNEGDAIISAFSKYQTVFPQLALLFALCVDPAAQEIHLEQVELAERWCSEYLCFHAQRVYGLIHPGGVGAESLVDGIEHNKITAPFTARDVQQKGWRGLGNKRDAQESLDVLVDLGWIRAESHSYGKGGNQTTAKYSINPRVFLKSNG